MRVVYLASLQEQLACSDENLEGHTATTVAQLRQLLAARGGPWLELAQSRIRCAADGHVVALDSSLVGVREVVFFPPVTGG